MTPIEHVIQGYVSDNFKSELEKSMPELYKEFTDTPDDYSLEKTEKCPHRFRVKFIFGETLSEEVAEEISNADAFESMKEFSEEDQKKAFDIQHKMAMLWSELAQIQIKYKQPQIAEATPAE